MQQFIILKLNKSPLLKRGLLQLVEFYYKFAPVIVGNLIRNPAYARHLLQSTVIAKPGLFSRGAIFNPGALLLGHQILLLANAQMVPWFKARGKKRSFYMQGNPLLIRLNTDSEKIVDQDIITEIIDLPRDNDYAIEDFRLFQWHGKIMINHSLVVLRKVDNYIEQAGSFAALSVLDEIAKTFRFCALPRVDFPLQNFEKNWVYKENGQQLLLFYSINPYKVLALNDEKEFFFKTIIEKKLSSKINDPGGFGTMVSWSTNPIDFDEQSWLIVIHQIDYRFTGRCYFHWAVLIDKSTLLPVRISSKPIFTGAGARGRVPGIRYISSILKKDNNILFFAGEGDVFVTVTAKSIEYLLTLFVTI